MKTYIINFLICLCVYGLFFTLEQYYLKDHCLLTDNGVFVFSEEGSSRADISLLALDGTGCLQINDHYLLIKDNHLILRYPNGDEKFIQCTQELKQ